MAKRNYHSFEKQEKELKKKKKSKEKLARRQGRKDPASNDLGDKENPD
ncbi:MAG: hypothetical protein JW896_09985 [Deltaproteobacteria bacterium]|nr:hypothetical protein [Deltaproteobacteria bacterium]